MPQNHVNAFDEAFGALLRESANPISRRSLLGRSVKLLLGAVGLAGAGAVPLLVDVPGWGRRSLAAGTAANNELQNFGPPAGFDSTCHNLHGVLCSGNCDPTAAGATDCLQSDLTQKLAAWVGCCKRKDTNEYQCYQMADVVCATRPKHWLVKCPGNKPTGRVWFGGKQGRRSYVCTIPVAVGNQYAKSADCAKKLHREVVPQ